ncbi:hypothetical protein B0H10DRAFT_1792842 [Mycena sp. CBHHK59/15]|nr:hypothetical protein B0H10DRAFT_1792842 [Mycena sp. CBHHK59/15]
MLALPQQAGWLPTWQLIVAAMAVFNSVQNFSTLKLTRRVYNNVPPDTITALQARTFAAWTISAAMVRLYAAYHLDQKIFYDMSLFTYFIAFGHFCSELLIFRTAKIGPGVLSPLIVSTTSLIWMFSQYNYYVKA